MNKAENKKKSGTELSEDLVYQILDLLPLPVCLLNQELEFVYYNLEFLKLSGITDTELIRKVDQIIINFEDLKPGIPALLTISTAGGSLEVYGEKKLLGKAYQLVCFDLLPQHDDLKLKKLQTLGLLAGGIAHDFNNILAGILGHSSYLQKILEHEDKVQVSLNAINEGGRRAAELTSEIVKFSNDETEAEATEHLVLTLIENTVSLLQGCLRPKTTIKILANRDQCLVVCRPSHFSQIIINLILNAHDAQIEANRQAAIEVSVRGLLAAEQEYEGMTFCITVKDCGRGMTSEQIDRATEPFYTTKTGREDLAGGNGFGLTTVQKILKKLGGKLVFESIVGQGTTAKVYLPGTIRNAQLSADEVRQNQEVSVETKTQEKILIVDDEQVVREVLNLNLQSQGFDCDQASNGAEALALFRKAPQAYRLIVADMLMPEMSGEELFRAVRESSSKQKFLIISGYCSQDVIDELLESGNCRFIAKPFQTEDLLAKIDELLDATEA